MGITLTSNFSVNAALPLDDRVTVADITARNAIGAGRRFQGMQVYVLSDTNTYVLKTGLTNSDWVLLGSGGSGQPTLIENLGISTTVVFNQLIINVTQANGSTPSSGSGAVRVATRNSSLTNGTYNIREITSSLSLTLDFLSNLGHTNGNDHPIWVYLIDNAGTLELAVSTVLFKKEIGIVSTLAEGGGFANTNSDMYSALARTNVPFTLIGKLISNQPSAGNWTNAISKIILSPTEEDEISSAVWTSTAQSISNNTTLKITFNNIDYDSHGCFDSFDSVFIQPKDGEIEFGGFVHVNLPSSAAGSVIARIYADGNLHKEKYLTTYVANNYPAEIYTKSKSAKGTVWDFRVYQVTGGSMTVLSSTTYSLLTFRMV